MKGYIKQLYSKCTSGQSVVEYGNEDEDDIKAGEDNEEKVEGVSHLFGREDEDNEDVSKDTKTADTCLHENCINKLILKNYVTKLEEATEMQDYFELALQHG